MAKVSNISDLMGRGIGNIKAIGAPRRSSCAGAGNICTLNGCTHSCPPVGLVAEMESPAVVVASKQDRWEWSLRSYGQASWKKSTKKC